MEITIIGAFALLVAFIYLIFLPGYNLLRTIGKLEDLEIEEVIIISCGVGIIILTFLSLSLSIPGSIGIDMNNLIFSMLIVIIFSNKEVIYHLRRADAK
ncbi:MAG: hypothetical protein SVJ22_01970 [Halobacteriota archaeon]|nr:hypothetical protein [Halobacteriota archaeon]